MGHIEPRHVPGVDNPADLFTKSVAAPTQRALGPMLSGQVMLNPVSKPLNALEKQEKKTGKKMTKKSPPPIPEKVSVLRVVRFEQQDPETLMYNGDLNDGQIWYLAKSRPKGFRGR